MPKNELTFAKAEHLKSKKVMEDVFENGKTLKKFPFVLKYMKCDFEKGASVQIVISVPKRKIKKATGRNRVRRQIKEVYRLNKKELLEIVNQQGENLALFLIYTGEEKVEYTFIDSKLKLLLQDLNKQLS